MKYIIFFFVSFFLIPSLHSYGEVGLHYQEDSEDYSVTPRIRWQDSGGSRFFCSMDYENFNFSQCSLGIQWRRNVMAGPLRFKGIGKLICSERPSWEMLNPHDELALNLWQPLENNRGWALQVPWAGMWYMEKLNYTSMGLQLNLGPFTGMFTKHLPTVNGNWENQPWGDPHESVPIDIYHGLINCDFQTLGLRLTVSGEISDYCLPGYLFLLQGRWKIQRARLDLQGSHNSESYRNGQGEFIPWCYFAQSRFLLPMGRLLEFSNLLKWEYSSSEDIHNWTIKPVIDMELGKSQVYRMGVEFIGENCLREKSYLFFSCRWNWRAISPSMSGRFQLEKQSQNWRGQLHITPLNTSFEQVLLYQESWMWDRWKVSSTFSHWSLAVTGNWNKPEWGCHISRSF